MRYALLADAEGNPYTVYYGVQGIDDDMYPFSICYWDDPDEHKRTWYADWNWTGSNHV